MKINFDDGYSYGLGLFETIHVYKNKPLFLKEHLIRINNSIKLLKIKALEVSEFEVFDYLKNSQSSEKNEVLKIMISEKNRIFTKNKYIYTDENYKQGFRLNIATTLRNETSIFCFHKTLSYCDNIYEKQSSINKGYNEPIFLNSKKEITEGAATNIFFIKDKNIYTPKLECGLLNGVVRDWVIKNYNVNECLISYKDIENFDESFLTNSLIGIMLVISIENFKFKSKEISSEILNDYKNYIEFIVQK